MGGSWEGGSVDGGEREDGERKGRFFSRGPCSGGEEVRLGTLGWLGFVRYELRGGVVVLDTIRKRRSGCHRLRSCFN